jgi:hypothetical protein
MLTRHFYRLDEVSAALMYSILRGKAKDAVFWTQELIDSGSIDELWDTLMTVWIWWIGVGRLEIFRQFILIQAQDEISDDDLVLLVSQMAMYHEKDGSVFALLVLGLTDSGQVDRVGNPLAAQTLLKQTNWSPIETTFIRACFQGKTRLAWNLIKANWSPSIWSLLHTIQNSKIGSPTLRHVLECLEQKAIDTMTWPCRACAVLAVCLHSEQVAKSLHVLPNHLPIHIAKERELWKEMEGRRSRRIFEIPTDCLMYITERGRTLSFQETNLDELRNLSYPNLCGCKFWKEQYEIHQPEKNDENLERFWTIHFPDDIPDEWSLADQKKSHGSGVHMAHEKPSLSRFLRSWYRRGVYPCIGIWMGVSEALREVENLEKDGILDDFQTGFDTLYWAFAETWNLSSQSWNQTPVTQRILEIC